MTRIAAFEMHDPLPSPERSRLLLSIRPWIDARSVGTLALSFLEERWNAGEIGGLARPGEFYDLTRYRPMSRHRDGQRQVMVPNTTVHFAHDERGQDWITLHALEPHNRGEDYVDSLVELIQRLNVREYIMVGSMYGPVPHTRPAVITGTALGDSLRTRMRGFGVNASTYEGPTTILATLADRLREGGAETASMLAQLPAYAQLDPDHHGRYGLLQKLDSVFELGLNLDALRTEGERQYATIDASLAQNAALANWVKEREAAYDRQSDGGEERPAGGPERPDEPKMSPEMEQFLHEMERRWETGGPSTD